MRRRETEAEAHERREREREAGVRFNALLREKLEAKNACLEDLADRPAGLAPRGGDDAA